MNRKFGQLRLADDLGALEEWATEAGESECTALYEMLFAVADSSLLRAYPVIDGDQPGAISVMVRHDLAVSLVFPEPGTFCVQAIGDPQLVLPEGA